MKDYLKNYTFSFLFIILVVIFVVFPISTSAFSFNPVSLLHTVTNTIVNRVSDIIYYLIMQKEYIFNDFKDPNVYPLLKIPPQIEKISVATSGDISFSITPVPVTTSTVIDIKKINTVSTVTPTPLFAPGPVVSIKSDTSINLPVINNIPAYNNDSLILKYTNKERSLAGLNILSSNLLLDQIASLRADDLFDNQYFEHESPDGHSATDLTKTVGYDYVYIGENLALGNFDGEKGIVSAWMDSPGHRANILSDKYSELGVVIKNGIFKGENVTIAVQIFGKPSSFCAKPNSKTKETIDEIGNSVRQMQVEAAQLFDNLNTMKNSPGLDASYYNQKIQEYNYYAKKVNDVVLALKIMIDAYNVQVGKYNVCIGS